MIKDKLSRLKAINIDQLFDDILRENTEAIIDMNQSQMYDEGVMNVNTGKKEQYSPATIRAKRNAPYNKTEHITLKWKGDFYKGMKLVIFKDKFVIVSDNLIWANYLEPQTRFGSALGLTEKSKERLRNIVKTEMGKKLRIKI